MDQLSWGEPRLLWLLLAVPVAAALRFAWSTAARRGQRRLGLGLPGQERLVPGWLAWSRQLLLWLGLAGCLVALARPRSGALQLEVEVEGANLVVLLDCSRSMLAKDLYPDRLEAARRKVLDLMAKAPQHRLALIPFAANPVLRSPLTGDRAALERLLQDCRPGLFPVQGTAIGAALDKAVDFLLEQRDRGRAVLVFSDGADADRERVQAAAKRAALEDIRVYGVFLGDPDRSVEVEIDGTPVRMVPERSTLDLLQEETGGLSVNVITQDDRDIQAILDHLAAHVATQPWREERRLVGAEVYQLVLWPALVCLALGALMGLVAPAREEEP